MGIPVKIGIILNSRVVPLWVYQVLKTITDSESGSIELVIYNRLAGKNQPKPPFVFQFYKKIDRLIFRHKHDYHSVVDSSGLLKDIPEILIHSKMTISCCESACYNLDLILNFSSVVMPQFGLKLAKFGIWSYTISDQYGENSNSYWEMVRKEPVLAVVLRCQDSFLIKKEMVIYRSWLPVNYNSIHKNQEHAYGLCSLIIQRLITGIYRSGPVFFTQQALKYKQKDEVQWSRTFSYPTNFQAFKNMLVILSRFLYRSIVYKNKWKWYLMLKNDSKPLFPLSGSYSSLIPPSDRFWADPFILSGNGKIFVFVEELIYRENIGHISVLELDKYGRLIHSEKILEKPWHLSYPSVFRDNNKYYMIPETSANKTVELYECTEFPGKWSFVMNLMENIIAKDTTPFFYRNKWWLFTAINEYSGFADHQELFLFYSNNLLTTQWIPHPCNPVITDVRTARPAGRIFIHDGKIYRPSQDCSERYGKAFNLNQITTLSETEYSEIMITKTEAIWEPELKGTHTFNFDDHYTVIDVYRFCKRFDLFL
ncbi:MAG: hypothetical protein AB2L24_28160 [Mangrovibacterium sp.]